MRMVSLQSGSNGNCIYVEAAGRKLLFDAGISGKQAELRLRETLGEDIRGIDAMFVSHDHVDHVRSAGIFQRKFGVGMYITAPTLSAARTRHRLGDLGEIATFRAGQAIRLDEVTIETLPTPHDGVDGCGFVVEAESKRLGILTDLGFVFPELEDCLSTLDAVLLESNFDEHMLTTGPYPRFLQNRIRGEGGHISNRQAAELVAHAGGRLQWLCLGHLSKDNNTPELAMATHREVLGGALSIHLAGRYGASEPLIV
jgi:phosphoribosyl 1,2-cyclic phosphodiesterase